MRTRRYDIFTTVRTEGSILPSDLLQRIADRNDSLDGLSPESYHLLKGERINEATNRSWNRLLGAWASFKSAKEKLPEADRGTTATRERWLLALFQELGYGRLQTSKALEVDGKSYPISHLWQKVPIHLVGFKLDLDRRTTGVAGAARTSPHSLVQELLNRSDDYLWGFVSNGFRLRILRDNVSLTRQAYVEFDLEGMMESEVYADFVLLWMLCHQSRVEGDRPESFWLEKWSKTAKEEGTRALDRLRGGVEGAIRILGSGFLSHLASRQLKDKLHSGELPKQDYFRQVLRVVYRLLFLFVAEDRELLLDPRADREAQDRYASYYSTARLRRLAEKRRGTQHADLWHGLKLVFEKLSGDKGCSELGLPVLGSFLWSANATPDLDGCELANCDLLEAVRSLAFTVDNDARRVIDYKNLGTEELGSVYESLLELHPDINTAAGTFDLKTVSGHERKSTGSYYTPSSLVNCLLDSALEPVLDEAVKKEYPEKAVLNLKICDPACGSGHFLIAASHRMAKRLAAIRTGDEEPSPEATRQALRDVIGHCIYGVDINPMAVELCKISLWMEALEPGKPLSFLEHKIQCGNSLLGATPALLEKGIPDEAFKPIEGDDKEVWKKYKKINKEERESGQYSFLRRDAMPWERHGGLATGIMNLEEIPDSDIEGIRRKQERWEAIVRSSSYENTRLWADALCAAFVWKKTKEFKYPITEEVFRRIEQNPRSVKKSIRDEIIRLSKQYQFFHWHLAFPDVFRVPTKDEKPENEQTGWIGGFDAVLGNPPWERVKLQEKEWFAEREPDVARAPTAAERRKRIDVLRKDNPDLHREFNRARRKAEGENSLLTNTRRYPMCGCGDVNTYAVFAEVNLSLTNPAGRVACIVPLGIVTDKTTEDFFQTIIEKRSLVSVQGFINEELLFPGVLHNLKFCLLVLCGSSLRCERPLFVFNCYNVEETKDPARQFELSLEDIALVNPVTRTCPTFFFRRSAEITLGIYKRLPVLDSEVGSSGWQADFFSMLHMTNDSYLFVTSPRPGYLPVYEAKMIHQFNHRFASYETLSEGERSHMLPETPAHLLADADFKVRACYSCSESEVRSRLTGKCQTEWLVACRRVTSAGLWRTCVFAIIPVAGVSNSITLMSTSALPTTMLACFVANMNSFVMDFCVRQKQGGANLSLYVMRQLPVPPVSFYASSPPWHTPISLESWIVPRVLELTYTAWDLESFAKDCGYQGPPFTWDEDRRFLLRCELDAVHFYLYGVERDEVDYIMETFPILKRRDEENHGEYRTKQVILEIYDAMAEAIRTGKPYKTILDPPPADPLLAHPPR